MLQSRSEAARALQTSRYVCRYCRLSTEVRRNLASTKSGKYIYHSLEQKSLNLVAEPARTQLRNISGDEDESTGRPHPAEYSVATTDGGSGSIWAKRTHSRAWFRRAQNAASDIKLNHGAIAWSDERDRIKQRRSWERRAEDARYEPERQRGSRDMRFFPPSSGRDIHMRGRQMRQRSLQAYEPRSQLLQARYYHAAPQRRQQTAAATQAADPPPPDAFSEAQRSENLHGIRAQLRKWHELNGDTYRMSDDVELDRTTSMSGNLLNNMTRLPDEQGETAPTRTELENDEEEAVAHFMQSELSDEANAMDISMKMLSAGDLVEIERHKTGRESIVAIYVRRTGLLSQFYTINGRWVHMDEKRIQYSAPGWVPSKLVTPLLGYLPAPETVETRLNELMEDAAIKDLNVPRHVSAGLISRMAQFQEETREVYRQHARALDGAHDLLAHDTDLRYGSLISAASTLLRTPVSQLSIAALFTVRRALSSAGFAFNIDRRSHRHTGYLQIRSKEQVKLVNRVRGWMREWQDDVAYKASLSKEQSQKHRSSKGANYIDSFIKKASAIVQQSREDRQPNDHGNLGPSQIRIPITPEQDSVRVRSQQTFTPEEIDIVRFLEAWALHQMFVSIPSLESLPPLLLQATGMYQRPTPLDISMGYQFLQELGTIMPYENRTRFDTHLLLPSSQHSKPLQNLMESLLNMAHKHNFQDSMKHLRHDWKQLPVYCIDSADAHEIDDGISIEEAARATHGACEWWVHIHIANPTAFFSRDHPLAKMARHMGETIYMPERTYMMLPRWCTQQHFSLGPDRPCLTFSARVNMLGETLEHKITPGTIRNVMRLTHQEVADLLGAANQDEYPETTLTIGGDVPPGRERRSRKADVTRKQVQELHWLAELASKRVQIRKRAGGLFFNSGKPEVNVWQQYKSSGLAWDHPFRKGWRRVEGDPVVQMKTRGLQNWFSPVHNVVGSLVQEHMLLASEIAAKWCQERQIPAIFRGSVRNPDRLDPDTFFREYLAPVGDRETGAYPMHLGMLYLNCFGSTELRTRPFKHKILGMDAYGKVTSPLRRYGDMIMHWQIEATLRQEAAQDRSFITEDPSADRAFLPFSESVLKTIFVGLQPREHLITSSKQFAEGHWMTQIFFRHIVYGEPLSVMTSNQPNEELLSNLTPHTSLQHVRIGHGEFAHDNGTKLHVYIHSPAAQMNNMPVGCLVKELNVSSEMIRPKDGAEIRQGDTWECEVGHVNAFKRRMILRPLRLVDRVDVDGSLRNLGRI